MAEGQKAGPLSHSRLEEFLQEPIIARLATITADGYPYITPVWFEYRDGEFYIVARGRSRYVENILGNAKVSISVARDVAPLTRVLVLGEARIVEGPVVQGAWQSVAFRMMERYLGRNLGSEYRDRTQERPRYLLVVRPASMTTWEGSEWHARYR